MALRSWCKILAAAASCAEAANGQRNELSGIINIK